MLEFYLLLSIILLPLIATLCIVFFGKYKNLRDYAHIKAGILNTILVGVLIYIFNSNDSSSLVLNIINFNNTLSIGFSITKFNLVFAFMVNLLWLVSVIYSIGYLRSHNENNQTRFFSFFALSIFATMGIAFASNLITTFLFYEMLTLSTFPLVAFKMNESNKKEIFNYLYILVISSITLFLLAIILVYISTGTTNYSSVGIFYKTPISTSLVVLILLLFLFGVAKAGLMPIHKWLPSAMVAPTPVSALLHAVAVVKSGVFIIIKIITEIFGISFLDSLLHEIQANQLILIIPAFSIIMASIIALMQQNIKKMLAYSTIGQLAYIVFAVLILNNAGLLASQMHILAHAVSKISLFFAAGALIALMGRNNIKELSGIAFKMPIIAITFSIGALSLIGLPLLIGFTTKALLINALLENQYYWFLLVIIVSSILQTLYFLPIIYKMFFEPYQELTPSSHHFEDGKEKHHILKSKAMNIAMIISSFLVIILFFYNSYIVNYLIG
jgi:multicomponent Na+:H+ antiporter subunit D